MRPSPRLLLLLIVSALVLLTSAGGVRQSCGNTPVVTLSAPEPTAPQPTTPAPTTPPPATPEPTTPEVTTPAPTTPEPTTPAPTTPAPTTPEPTTPAPTTKPLLGTSNTWLGMDTRPDGSRPLAMTISFSTDGIFSGTEMNQFGPYPISGVAKLPKVQIISSFSEFTYDGVFDGKDTITGTSPLGTFMITRAIP